MRRALACRDFRLLWLSQVGSTIGDRVVIVALALYVNRIGTPTDVGIVLAAEAIPFVLLILIGGVWADRLPRQKVMLATDVIRGALHALLAVLILTGEARVWQIALIEVGYGAAHAFFRPAYTGLVPQTVPEELVQEAQAISYLSSNVASFTGPALATALVFGAGAGVAFALDAATFLASALLLTRVRARERGERGERQRMLGELTEGLREVRARPWVGLVVASAAIGVSLGAAPFQALGPAIADDAYGSAAIFGVVSALFGVGTIAGSAVAVRWRPERPLFYGMIAVLPWTLNYVAFAAGIPLAALVPFTLAAGFGIALFMVWWETALATGVPPHALSRVSSVDWMGSLGLLPLGFLLAGPIGEAVGLRETLLAGALISGVVDVLVLCSPAIRGFRQPNSGTPLSGVEASA